MRALPGRGSSEATWYELEVQTAGGTQMFDLWYTNTSAGCETDTSCVVTPAEAVNIVNGEYQWRVRDYGSVWVWQLDGLAELHTAGECWSWATRWVH